MVKVEHDDAQALASYADYEYQILATVWLGLDLTLSGKAEAIVIEPPSDEDVGADLNVDPEIAISGVSVSSTLQIQIKLRNGNVWNKSSFASLIEDRTQKGDSAGPKPRIRAVSYLRANPSHKYILLTNADGDGGLKPFAFNALQETSKAKRLPKKHTQSKKYWYIFSSKFE